MNDLKFVAISKQHNVTFLDWPDDYSDAIIFFFIGCNNKCKGCQNYDLTNVDWIKDFTPKSKELFYETSNCYLFEKTDEGIENFCKFISDLCVKNRTNKIIFQGGDPLFENNIEFVKKANDILMNKYLIEICIYTGSDIDFVKENNIHATFFKCGKYIVEQKQESIKTSEKFSLASKNQNFYNSNYEQISENGILYF